MALTAPIFCCGFECGQRINGAGTHWDTGFGTNSITTTSPINGLRSARTNPTATFGAIRTTFSPGGTLIVQRFNFRVDVIPNANCGLCGNYIGGTGKLSGMVYKASDGKVYAGTFDGTTLVTGATGVTLTTGLHTADIRINVVANPWVIEVQIDGVALGTSSPANAASTINISGVGEATGTVTMDIYWDDVVFSVTSSDYPIGNGKILSFVPNADGTHTATTTTIVKGTAAVPVGANVAGATDVFNWVNARPIGGGATDATRLVNQQTVGTTLYAEVDFEPTTEPSPPRAVEVLVVDQQATTAAGDMHIKLNDNGVENVILDRTGTAGVITDRYTSKQYATMVGGGAWTLARFNALKIRFGYSADATPDQYWRGAMIEAEFPPTEPTQLDKWYRETNQPYLVRNEIIPY